MKKSISLSGILVLSLLIFTSFFNMSCKGKNIPPDASQVSAITRGTIGKNEVVIVEFVNAQDTAKPLDAKAFVLSPAVKGSVSWRNEFTLVFTPSESYKGGQKYQARVRISGISPFSFSFTAALPLFEVEFESVRLSGDDDILIAGIVSVDDDADI